jgi:hypothetical protein
VLAAFDPEDDHHEQVRALLADDGGVLRSTDTLLARAAEIAELHAISVYDAAYAAAATDAGHRLVSCDERDLVSKDLAALPADARAPTSTSRGDALDAAGSRSSLPSSP